MKKKLITACVMPFLAACGQNSSDIFTISLGMGIVPIRFS